MLESTDEETRILKFLRTDWASKNAPVPWLKEVKVQKAEMVRSGIFAELKLSNSGHVTREKMSESVEHLRLFFDIEDHHQLVVLPGGRASLVRLEIRTRRVTEEMDMLWHPGREGIGVDSVTGDVVKIPFLNQIQFSGAKGSGKSWAFRPLMASLAMNPDFEPHYFDPKMVEGYRWQGLIKTCFPGEFAEALEDCSQDMERRAGVMRKANATVWRPEFGPYRIVIVDEGREFLGELRRADKLRARLSGRSKQEADVESLVPEGGGALDNLVKLSSMGRAWGVFLWWTTQYPISSGSNPGVDNNVDANTDYRFSLRVSKPGHASVALGEDADYGPHLLTADDRNRGLGYLGGYGPSLIQTWTMTDEMISMLSRPNDGRGGFPRDVALAALKMQSQAVWTPSLLASTTACGLDQARRFLLSFVREGLMTMDRDNFRLVK